MYRQARGQWGLLAALGAAAVVPPHRMVRRKPSFICHRIGIAPCEKSPVLKKCSNPFETACLVLAVDSPYCSGANISSKTLTFELQHTRLHFHFDRLNDVRTNI
jgi:hypothetical protein